MPGHYVPFLFQKPGQIICQVRGKVDLSPRIRLPWSLHTSGGACSLDCAKPLWCSSEALWWKSPKMTFHSLSFSVVNTCGAFRWSGGECRVTHCAGANKLESRVAFWFFRPGTQVLRVTPDAFTAQKTFPRFNLSFPTLGLVTLCLRELYLNPVLSAS